MAFTFWSTISFPIIPEWPGIFVRFIPIHISTKRLKTEWNLLNNSYLPLNIAVCDNSINYSETVTEDMYTINWVLTETECK